MTQLLERAFTEASRLTESEQDAVASLLLAELDSERRWSHSFASSQDQLAKLADEALREFATGETRPLDLKRDFPLRGTPVTLLAPTEPVVEADWEAGR